ncbi:MAG: AsmA-like C-terminal region-containing protein, partial [Flavitalea sp.]
MRKTWKYILRGAGILLGILVICWGIIYWYVSSNKKEIIAKISTELKDRMDANITIGDLDPSFFQTFPFLSLRLSNVSLRDTMWEKHHHDFLKAEKFFIRVNPFSLFSSTPKINKILVEKGSLYLFTDTTNYSNAYILNAKKKQTNKGLKPPFSGIELREVKVSFINPFQGKLMEFDIRKLTCNVESEDSLTSLTIRTDMLVKNLAFNTDRGSFLRGKRLESKFEITLGQDQISFDNILMKIDKQPLTLSGNFILGKDPSFTISIAAKKGNYKKLAGLLTERLEKKLDTFNVAQPFDVNAKISGSLLPKAIPHIAIGWAVKNSDIKIPAAEFQNASFTGIFTNQIDKSFPKSDSNSAIIINKFTGNWESIPLTSSKIVVTQIRMPKLAFDLRTSVALPALNDLTGTESFAFSRGNADVNISFSGPLMKADTSSTTVTGVVALSDGEFTYLPRNLTLANCKGALVFDRTALYLKDISANSKSSDMQIGGRVDNFLSMLNTNSDNMMINLDVASTKLDLTDFTQNLQKRSNVSVKKTKARYMKIAKRLDHLIETAAMNIALSAKKVQYKKFLATNIKAALSLDKDEWNLQNISINHGEGRLMLSGKIKTDGAQNPFSIGGKIENLDISKVFYSFNNFSFDGLSDKNLKGSLSADFHISASIDSKAEIVPYSTKGYINLSLKNGALQNFEPMQKISASVFKKRDMSDIRFAELKDNIEIDGTLIKVNSMEIQSTVLTMFIEGIYDMKTGPDMSILVPLSNLKKRGPDFELVNEGTDSKKGVSV